MKKILVIHGPNLNMLGIRKKEIYGNNTLEDVNNMIREKAKELNFQVDIYQYNGEGEIISQLHRAYNNYHGLIINPGAYSHYSIGIRDAIEATDIPTIEVHISNIYNRESFRANSIISPVCMGQIAGLGIEGYILALERFSFGRESSLLD